MTPKEIKAVKEEFRSALGSKALSSLFIEDGVPTIRFVAKYRNQWDLHPDEVCRKIRVPSWRIGTIEQTITPAGTIYAVRMERKPPPKPVRKIERWGQIGFPFRASEREEHWLTVMERRLNKKGGTS